MNPIETFLLFVASPSVLIFDRLFGAYVAVRDDMPCRNGLVPPMTSYNLFEVEFSQWIALPRDLADAGSPRECLGSVFRPPGWMPDSANRARVASDIL